MGQVSDNDMLRLALSETAKLVPYITSSRKTVKLYLKTCLDYWSSAEDSVRIAAFLSVRRLAAATDESIVDAVLKVRVYFSFACGMQCSKVVFSEHVLDPDPVV